MKLVFDPDFDHGAWPGPLAERDAVAGEEWVGEAALVGRLEVALGLGGPPPLRGERVATLVPRVRATAGFWSASAVVDPFGTARRLLEWRDALHLAGWRGHATAPRLHALHELTQEALPGIPARLTRVIEALSRRRPDVELLDVLTPRAELAPLWRDALRALEARGIEVRETNLAAVPLSPCDLHQARSPHFLPRGDGSLTLLRAYGPLASGEEVASWLGSLPDLGSTVVVAPDSTLDDALRRHGLPTTGAAARAGENLLLRILPLVLALAWRPADPELALDLLTLPEGPIPSPVARRLARALHEWPAVDSDAWRAALSEGVLELDEDRRRRVTERMQVIFAAVVPRTGPYPTAEIALRLAPLESWMRGMDAYSFSTAEAGKWQPALEQVAAMRRLLAATGLTELTAAQLQWLIDDATLAASSPPVHPAQAGLAMVGSPGAIAGSARSIVWWNFTLDVAPPIRRLPLLAAERAELAASGVELPDPGGVALRAAERWRRPLHQAREHLVLVCPRRRADGEVAFPHPLWDEVLARMSKSADRTLVERDRLHFVRPVRRQLGIPRAVPSPRREWHVPAPLLHERDLESPSSLGDALGCSFRWSALHLAGIRVGATGSLPGDERLIGIVAHEILAKILGDRPASAAQARQRAEALFDAEGSRLAAAFFLPGGDEARGQARLAIARAAETLTTILHDSGLHVLASEEDRVCAIGPWKDRLRGRADLVAGDPPAVIDLKWGGAKYRRQSLEAGTALQLAAYSLLFQSADGPWPAVAYFILKEQRLLTATPNRFRGAELVDGPLAAEIWEYFENAYQVARERLRAGVLVAPANPDADGVALPDADAVDGDRLVLAPPCPICDFAGLCGRLYQPGAR